MHRKGLFLPSLVVFVGIACGVFLLLAYTGTQRSIELLAAQQPSTPVPESSNSFAKQILDLTIPSESANAIEWQHFFSKVKGLQVRDKRGRYSSDLNHSSPKLGLLAVMAKQAPSVFINLLERGEINQYAFSHFLESGLLLDWSRHSDFPEHIMLKNSQALFAVALKHEDTDLVRRQVADAFFSSSVMGKLDMRSLVFAIPAMDALEHKQIVAKLLNGQFKYDPRDVVKLERFDFFTPEELLQLVDHQAYDNKSMSSYQFEASKWGSERHLMVMALDADTNDGQPMNFYCALCTLAAFTEGLVAQTLSKAARDGSIRVRKGDNAWVLDLAGGTE